FAIHRRECMRGSNRHPGVPTRDNEGSAGPAKVFCQNCSWLERWDRPHVPDERRRRCFHPNALWNDDSFLRPGQRYLEAAERNRHNACPDFAPLTWRDVCWHARWVLLFLAGGTIWYFFD